MDATYTFSLIGSREVYRTDEWGSRNIDAFGLPMYKRWECSQALFWRFFLPAQPYLF